jgi:hypothetical protein
MRMMRSIVGVDRSELTPVERVLALVGAGSSHFYKWERRSPFTHKKAPPSIRWR